MKFAISYSCGKDSTLALHKMREGGHTPVCLVVMVNEAVGRSYFHGADAAMLERYSQALALPIITCPADGSTYQTAFEAGLRQAKRMGAEAVCFGDIDIAQNRQWEEDRCAAAGLLPCFPLWQRGREEMVYELIRLGYKCLIKSVNRSVLPMDLLGTYLDEASVAVMKAAGIDICGENGEYHTLAVDGPVFQRPMVFRIGDKMELGDYAVADIS
ncbi:MAG: diphthine--ammonia ligase [Oscillospiraceae bacterium]|nr:diphthine--ammonia ligase [Oscillospiraceae bacterium]